MRNNTPKISQMKTEKPTEMTPDVIMLFFVLKQDIEYEDADDACRKECKEFHQVNVRNKGQYAAKQLHLIPSWPEEAVIL